MAGIGSTKPYSVDPATPTGATVSSSTSSAIASTSARWPVAGAVRNSTPSISAAFQSEVDVLGRDDVRVVSRVAGAVARDADCLDVGLRPAAGDVARRVGEGR